MNVSELLFFLHWPEIDLNLNWRRVNGKNLFRLSFRVVKFNWDVDLVEFLHLTIISKSISSSFIHSFVRCAAVCIFHRFIDCFIQTNLQTLTNSFVGCCFRIFFFRFSHNIWIRLVGCAVIWSIIVYDRLIRFSSSN